jgi:hypothetical protein
VEEPEINDLTNISFDEFVKLVFEQPIQPEPAEKDDLSLTYVDTQIDAKKICAYYVRLFQQPEFLLSRFTKQQLENGFWAIMGHSHEWSAGNIIDWSDAHYQAEQSASSPWQPYLNDSLSTNPSTLRFTCGGIPFATGGTAGIEAENVAARTWNCKIYSFVR